MLERLIALGIVIAALLALSHAIGVRPTEDAPPAPDAPAPAPHAAPTAPSPHDAPVPAQPAPSGDGHHEKRKGAAKPPEPSGLLSGLLGGGK